MEHEKTFFKCCYKTNINLWEVLGKKKFKKLTLKDLKNGEKNVLKELNKLPVPVITTSGNYDPSGINDQYYPSKRESWKWADKNFYLKC